MFDNIKYILIIVLFIFLGYFYNNNNILKGELKIANDLNSALEESIKSKDLEIQQLNKDVILITETKNKLDEVKNKQQKEIDSLNDKIKKHNLTKISYKKPVLVQHIINKATINEFKCIEDITKGIYNGCK